MKTNTKALQEMNTIVRTCNTPNAFSAGIKQILKKYSASEKVVKTYKGGLKKIAILDKDGLLIGEYTKG